VRKSPEREYSDGDEAHVRRHTSTSKFFLNETDKNYQNA